MTSELNFTVVVRPVTDMNEPTNHSYCDGGTCHCTYGVDWTQTYKLAFSGSISSSTLHARGAELLPGQVDGVVVLLGVTLLPLLEIWPTTNVLQTLLGVPHRDQFLGLNKGHCWFLQFCFTYLSCSCRAVMEFALTHFFFWKYWGRVFCLLLSIQDKTCHNKNWKVTC